MRIVTEYAWHSLFARDLFIVPPPAPGQPTAEFSPEFTVIDVPQFEADPARGMSNSDTTTCQAVKRQSTNPITAAANDRAGEPPGSGGASPS